MTMNLGLQIIDGIEAVDSTIKSIAYGFNKINCNIYNIPIISVIITTCFSQQTIIICKLLLTYLSIAYPSPPNRYQGGIYCNFTQLSQDLEN
jgi:hypothetical protein